ncbi:MAG: cell division protein FtsA [Terracidiphilus sp.]
MSQRLDNLIVVLDIGGAWTRVLAADVNEGALRYRGHGVVPSGGMRKGLISELGPAAKAVKAANERAERSADLNIDECVVGIGGPHIRGLNTRGGFDLGNRKREIYSEDIRTAVDRARAFERPPDREILHLLRRQFIIDGQPGIFDPLGMEGVRLDLDLHIATCSGSALQSTVTCANRAGLEVTEAVLESISSAEATLTADERELGVCLVDIGAHSSDLVVFFEGAVVHTASVPIGGAHFTNDLATVLQMPVAQAEDLKCRYGNAVVTAVPQDAFIEIAHPQTGTAATLPLRMMAEVLEPRARELLHYVKESLRQGEVEREGSVEKALGGGCVLTGGGALLPGMLDVAESQLLVKARTGLPVRLSHMPGELAHPGFSTAIGMLLYAHRTRAIRPAENNNLRSKLRAIFAASY